MNRTIRIQRFDIEGIQAAFDQLVRTLPTGSQERVAQARGGSGGMLALASGSPSQDSSGGTPGPHTHGQGDVQGLAVALGQLRDALSQAQADIDALEDGKSDIGHAHLIDQIPGLWEALEEGANILASGSVHGVVRLSVPPANGLDPIAVADNDPRLQSIAAEAWVHSQAVASDTWVINHDLGFIPSVVVVDSGGNINDPGVAHNDSVAPTVTVLSFAFPTSGTARLS